MRQTESLVYDVDGVISQLALVSSQDLTFFPQFPAVVQGAFVSLCKKALKMNC